MASGTLPWRVVVAMGLSLAGCQTPPRALQGQPAADTWAANAVPGRPAVAKLPGNAGDQDHASGGSEATAGTTSDLSPVVLVTDPARGELFIAGRDRPVASGASVVLSPGTYRIRAELAGYRPGYLEWHYPQRRVGGQKPVVVPLGEGFAMVTVTSLPTGATLRLDGEVVGQTPLRAEISAGSHRLTLVAADFAVEARAITVAPGKPQRLKIHLRELSGARRSGPTSGATRAQAPARQETPTAPATARLPGRQALPFESRRPELALRLGRWVRAELLREPQDLRLAARLLAGRKEPGALRLYMDQGWGDVRCGKTVEHCHQALLAVLSAPPNPRQDIDQRVVPIATPALGQVLAAILAHRVAAEPRTLLLDLNSGQFAGQGEHIDRTTGDGAISLLALGGKGLLLGSAGTGEVQPWPPATRGVHWRVVPPGETALNLAWQVAPQRLLVVARWAGSFTPPQDPPPLLAREKRWFELAGGDELVAVTELAAAPRRASWQRSEERASAASDIAFRELGPHELPGRYRRIWILHYTTGEGITQRQVALTYRVARRAKDFATHQFLRHASPGVVSPGRQ